MIRHVTFGYLISMMSSCTSYNCISNITICGRTVEEDYPISILCILGRIHYFSVLETLVYSFVDTLCKCKFEYEFEF